MKKLAFFCYDITESGGIERMISLISNGLMQGFKYEIVIISLRKNDNIFFEINSSIKIYYLNCSLFKSIFLLRNIITSNSIQYLITVDTLLSYISIPASFGLGIKKIGWEHYSFNSSLINLKRKIGRFISILFFNKIVLLSERDRINWIKFFKNKNKIIVISNPSPFNPPITNNKSNYALAVGRLRYEKGFDRLLNIWSKAIDFIPSNSKLYIIGDGEEKKNLILQIDKLGLKDSVLIKDFTKNIEDYYRYSKVYCLTSRTEAMPMVLIEALSFSTPLIAMDCYTGPKEIIENGYNGYVVDESDYDDFSEKIISIFNLKPNDYSELSKNSYISSKKYSLDDVIILWNKLLK